MVRGRKIRQKRLDMRGAEVDRMTLVVEEDKSFNPVDVGLFRTDAVMLEPDTGADAVEKTRRLGTVHGAGKR